MSKCYIISFLYVAVLMPPEKLGVLLRIAVGRGDEEALLNSRHQTLSGQRSTALPALATCLDFTLQLLMKDNCKVLRREGSESRKLSRRPG